ncbi:sugar-binding protein [Cohnella nanjingensis]|uniref:Ig-like domain-containing protein n=1 Tax=Cohnella nanjingensis TaxID=1387779 RepID=A0A7X0VJC4_9BACL|nr:sugar-binding protein [Cohnella nanjingensis]MBB6674574.1 Ig-like domain-containing protein [Cohnella nanjingensis]
MKKWLSFLLAAALLVSIAAPAAAQTGSGEVDSEQTAPIIRTTFQTELGYSEKYDVKSDAVMVYATKSEGLTALIHSWKNKGYRVDAMISISHDWEGIYELGTESGIPHPEVVQMRKDGTKFRHVDPKTGYVTPTQGWNDYLLGIAKQVADAGAHDIVFEEPEYYTDAGYEGAFKSEWQAYYGTEWEDPASSDQARFKSEKLKAYLYTRSINYISTKLKEYKPGLEVWVASHSTINYNNYSVVAANIDYYDLPNIDGFIGQAWSDTARYPIPFEGQQEEHLFESAFLEYSSLSELQKTGDGKSLYALADPKSDNPNLDSDWEKVEADYKQTIIAQFLQPKLNKFQIMPWPSRAFVPAPMTYKTIQMNVFEASKALSEQPFRMEAGTQGVTFLISDTMTYQRGSQSTAAAAAMYGPTMPLVVKGIPVNVMPVERSVTSEALAHTKVLVMSYDSWNPLKPEYNDAIADWVKNGGILLYLGGENKFQHIDEWWNDVGSPQQDLLNKLGVSAANGSAVPVSGRETALQPTESANSIGSGESITVPKPYTLTSYTLSGSAVPLYQTGNQTVAFRQQTGQGQLIYFGADPSFFSSSKVAAQAMRDLTKYALGWAGVSYTESNTMKAVRGPFVAVHTEEQSAVIPGRYIDLWDSRLTVVDNKAMLAHSSAMLYDISLIDTSVVPKVYFANGEISDRQETATETKVTVAGPKDTQAALRIGAASAYPQQVTATDSQGQPVSAHWEWENASRSLLVKFGHQPQGVTVNVDWSSEQLADTPQTELTEFVIRTNSKNEDADYKGTFVGSVGANPSFRFADGTSKMVYKLNMSAFPQAELTLELANNFTVELSPDGTSWSEVLNAQAMTGIDEHNMANRDKYAVNYEAYKAADGLLYIRIGDGSPTDGWGGALFGISIRYMQPVPAVSLAYSPDSVTLKGEQAQSYHVLLTNESGQSQQVNLAAMPIALPTQLLSFTPGSLDEAPYLFKEEGTGVSPTKNYRHMDNRSYAIYKFQLPEGFVDPKLSIDIGNQFVVSLASQLTYQPTDNNWSVVDSDWTVVDKETNHVTDLVSNRSVRTYDVGAYVNANREFYLKFSDSFPEDGWGALILNISLSGAQTVPLDTTFSAQQFTLGAKQSQEIAFSLRASESTPAGTYEQKLKVTADAGEMVYKLPVIVKMDPPFYAAQKSYSNISIDGQISDGEWDNADEIVVSPDSPIMRKFGKVWGAVTDGADLTSRYKIKWDQNNLYLLEQRSDNVVHFTDIGSQMYLSDATMLFLDIDHNKSGSSYRDGDYAIMMTPGGTVGAENPRIFIREGHDDGAREYAFIGGQIAAKVMNNGYVMEAAIPWSALNVYPFTPAGGAQIGMTLLSTDNDDVGDRKKWGQAMWVGDGDNQANWADMTFVELKKLDIALPAKLDVGSSADASVNEVYTDGTTKPPIWPLTFSSSDPNVASVDPHTGKVTGVKRGEAVITVTSGQDAGITGRFRMTIEPVLQSISIQSPAKMKVGDTDYPIVLGHYNDGIDSRVTEGLAFSSEKTSVATIDAATGLIRALKPGNTRITAVYTGHPAIKAEVKLLVHPK